MNSNKKIKNELAPLGLRVYALLGDYLLGHFLTYFLLSFPFFVLLEKKLVKLLMIGTELNSFSVGFFFYWHLITVLLRFCHTLLLGVSPFEYMAGLSNEGPWWWQRLAGGGRVILAGMTDPFLVGNLPLLVGKMSFKESALGCQLLRPQTQKKKSSLIIPLILAGVLALFSPLFKDFRIIDPLIVSFDKVKKESLTKGGDFKSFKIYKSEKFHFETFSSLANNRYSLYPDFEFIKVKLKKRVNPFLLIYDHKRRNSGELKVGHSLNLLELLKRGAVGNPLFKSKYPALYEAILGPLAASKPQKWVPGQTQKPLFSSQLKSEVRQLIQASFELGARNLFGHLFKYGPFLRSYIRLREAFLTLVRPGAKAEVDFIKMGSIDFLRFRQVFPKELPFNKGVIETYIPIAGPYSVSIVMGWDHNLPGALSANTFRKSFLGDAKWFFDYRAVFPFPDNEKEMNPLVLLDFLSKDLKRQEQRELREEYLYHYYYQQCRTYLSKTSEDKIGQDMIKNNMMRMTSLFEIKNKGKEKNFSAPFMERWSELFSAFIAKNSYYFNLE